MKTKKADIRALKNKHRLELVMQETGETFDKKTIDSDRWKSKTTPGLTVDIHRQVYEIKLPGKDDESGDVIAWLQRRYAWSFGMAVKYLQKRPADPPRQAPKKNVHPKKGESIRSVVDDTGPVGDLQEKALELGGERIRRFFSWSHWDIGLYNILEEIRIDPTFAPHISHCQRCEQRFDWLGILQRNSELIPVQHGYKIKHTGPIQVIAYSIKRRLKVSDLNCQGNGGELQNALNEVISALVDVFVEDDDGIVCADCAAKEIKFHIALSLCERAARIRFDQRLVGSQP